MLWRPADYIRSIANNSDFRIKIGGDLPASLYSLKLELVTGDGSQIELELIPISPRQKDLFRIIVKKKKVLYYGNKIRITAVCRAERVFV